MTGELRRPEEYDEERDLAGDTFWLYHAPFTAPGQPRLPMYSWMCHIHIMMGYLYATEKLCQPYCKGTDTRSYKGYQLFRLVLTTPEEAEERLAKHREALRPLIENFDRLWADAVSEMMGYYEQFKRFDYEKASWYELIQLFWELVRVDRRQWEYHFYFMEGIGAVYLLFEDLCKELLGIDDTDPLFVGLLAGFDARIYQTDRGLWELSQRADQLGLRDLLLNSKPEEVIPKLGKIEAGRQWVNELRDFLWENGWRLAAQTITYDYPSWVEDPAPAISQIQVHLNKGGAYERDEVRLRQEAERKKAEEEVLSRVPPEQRDWFRTLMTLAQKGSNWFEDHVFYLDDYVHAIGRYVCLKIGERLSRVGCIEKPEDTLYLTGEELKIALVDPEVYNFKPTVERVRAQWEENKKTVPPPFIPNLSFEEVTQGFMKARDPSMKMVMGKLAVPRPELKADLLGNCGSPGVVEGPARLIFTAEQIREIQQGDILVCPSTGPDWMPAFSLVKGVVTAFGGTLSHAAVVGREFGIPVVLNCGPETTAKIKTGQRLKIDANLGAVWILDK